MKLIHLSDLHLGKKVKEFSMIEDQKYILIKIINVIDEEKPDGILIAGDVYDKSVPSEEAMQLWDDFLNHIAQRKIPLFAISGNHDSAIRFSDHGKLVDLAGIHLAPAYKGTVTPLSLEDEYGKVNIYMLPFIKPVVVRQLFSDENIVTYTDACRVAIEHMDVNENERNVLIAHQYITGAERCESEEVSIGGLDNVDVSVFDCFDYVALGHLHGKQHVERETVRYCGTPLKYSFSEKDHKKSVTIVEIGEKGKVNIREKLLTPKHDLREIKGDYATLSSKAFYEGTVTEDYIHAILTDEDDVFDAMGKLRVIYPNLMDISYDNERTRENRQLTNIEEIEQKSPLQLFETFFETQNNQPMSDEQKAFCVELISSIWEV